MPNCLKKTAKHLKMLVLNYLTRLKPLKPLKNRILHPFRSFQVQKTQHNPQTNPIFWLFGHKMLILTKKSMRKWWNGRHARLRGVWATVWVQIPSFAPKKQP